MISALKYLPVFGILDTASICGISVSHYAFFPIGIISKGALW